MGEFSIIHFEKEAVPAHEGFEGVGVGVFNAISGAKFDECSIAT